MRAQGVPCTHGPTHAATLLRHGNDLWRSCVWRSGNWQPQPEHKRDAGGDHQGSACRTMMMVCSTVGGQASTLRDPAASSSMQAWMCSVGTKSASRTVCVMMRCTTGRVISQGECEEVFAARARARARAALSTPRCPRWACRTAWRGYRARRQTSSLHEDKRGGTGLDRQHQAVHLLCTKNPTSLACMCSCGIATLAWME